MKLLYAFALTSSLVASGAAPVPHPEDLITNEVTALKTEFKEDEKNLVTPEDSLKTQAELLGAEVLVFQKNTELVDNSSIHSQESSISKKVRSEKTIYFISKDRYSRSVQRIANSHGTSTYIVSNAARINSTIVYDVYTDSSQFNHGKLLSTSGSVSNFNSGFRFSYATVVLGSSGIDYPQQSVTSTTYSSSWSFSAPSNWGYNLMGNGFCSIGSTVTAYITRDGNTLYSGSCVNNVG